ASGPSCGCATVLARPRVGSDDRRAMVAHTTVPDAGCSDTPANRRRRRWWWWWWRWAGTERRNQSQLGGDLQFAGRHRKLAGHGEDHKRHDAAGGHGLVVHVHDAEQLARYPASWLRWRHPVHGL